MKNKSQQHILGSLTIIIMLLLAAIPALMFVNFIDIVSGEVTPPIISTNTTTNINITFAGLNGYLQSNGSARTWYGFRYGLSNDSLTNNVTIGTDGTNCTTFSYTATGLSEGTAYFVQAWANNSNNFSSGIVETFWTNSTWANSTLNNRIRIVINHAFVDEDLYDFPVLVVINSTIGSYCDGGKSIRFYKNSTVQYYYEIDTWNSSSSSFVWVNVTHVYDDIDTVFYLYYNNTNAVSNSSGLNTWNKNYIAVYHMNSTTTTLWDSTENRLGTKDGANNPQEVNGKIAKAQDFEFTNEDKIIADKVGAILNMTVELWYEPESDGTYQIILENTYTSDPVSNKGFLLYRQGSDNKLHFVVQTSTGNMFGVTSTTVLNNDVGYYCTGVLSDENYGSVYVNGVREAEDNNITGNMVDHASAKLRIGCDKFDAVTYREWIDGIVDEVRISNIARSEAWLKTSFHTQNQTPSFLTFTETEEKPPAPNVFLINGLTNNRITWQGEPNSYVWCNATGTANETLEFNMTINETTNITQICVWVGDSNDTGNYLNASNISVVFSSDNTTWNTIAVNTTSFVDGGSNVTLNISTWTDTNGMYGTNPFNGTGLTNKTTLIFCRFRLDILIAQPVDIYWNSTVWKIYMGYIV